LHGAQHRAAARKSWANSQECFGAVSDVPAAIILLLCLNLGDERRERRQRDGARP
jgi:hypothetical protein